MCSHLHVILHLPQPAAKFRSNQTKDAGVMTSYPFTKWRPQSWKYTFDSGLVTALV